MVSEVGYGALEIGRDWAPDVNEDPSHLSEKDAGELLNALLDLGINFIDTAPAYWHSEEFIGKAIAHRRNEYVLATKVGEHCDPTGSVYDYSFDATLKFIDTSLQRLKTDHIDLIQIHSASMEVLEKGETLEAMREAKKAGKVRHIGMTGGVAECVRALELGGYETVQFPYNLLDISAEEKLFPLAREKKAGVIIMRGLAGGKLTAKYKTLKSEELRNQIWKFDRLACESVADHADGLCQLAISFVLSQREVSTAIFGSRRLEAIKANLTAAATPLSPNLLGKAHQLAAEVTTKSW